MKKYYTGYLWLVCYVLVACGGDEGLSPQQQEALDKRLIQAVAQQDLEAIDSSINAGANVNTFNVEATPLLTIAIGTRNKKLVEKLLDADADVNATREAFLFSTPLMEVSTYGDTAIARLLIQNGAKVNQTDTLGDPAINWASYYGHLPLIDLLVKNGADFQIKSRNGNAIDVAMKQYQDKVIDYLITKGAGNELEAEEKQFIQAIKEDDLLTAIQLLEDGANADQTDEVGSPAIVLAASNGNLEMVRLLIKNGADLDQFNRVGHTALSRAAYFGYLKIMDRLLRAGADPEESGEKTKFVPILSAATGGNPEAGKLLIAHDVDIDAQDAQNGFTPLMFATAYGHVGFVKLLVDNGANPYIKSYDGTGLYDMLSLSRNNEINKILEEYVMKR